MRQTMEKMKKGTAKEENRRKEAMNLAFEQHNN